jgi:enoyl-CoA hydratase/carnithine racemase
MISPQEALAIGLVDKVVPKERLLATAEAAMAQALRLPDEGRRVSSPPPPKGGSRAHVRSHPVVGPGGPTSGCWRMLKSLELGLQACALEPA